MPFSTNLAKRSTLDALVNNYKVAAEEIIQAYALLESAKNRLNAAYQSNSNFDTNPRDNHCVGEEGSKFVLKKIKKDAWCTIVERMELRRLLSVKRREELDRQLYEGDTLPEITNENIIAMLETSADNVKTYFDDAVKEVFDYLRPPGSKLKTNTEFELGKKVILSLMVEKGWSNGKFRVNYHRDKYLTSLDNVFNQIDGKGPIKTYHGPLYDAIENTQDGTGQTSYFRFKCYMNGNLHLEFIRPDLVARLNAIAGGNRLKTNTGK